MVVREWKKYRCISMGSILLTLALATCLDNPGKCTYTEISDSRTVITACGLAPDKQGAPISFNTRVGKERYLIVLEPKCTKV